MNTTAKVILFPQSTNKGFPLKIRIIQNRKPSYIGLKLYLTESQKQKYWNDKKKELKKSYPFYNKVFAEFNKEMKQLGIDTVNNEIATIQEPINTSSFSQYFKSYMETLRVKSQIGLLHKTTSVLYQLELFYKESGRPSDILFNDLNIDFINEFQNHLVKQNVLPVSQRGYIEKIRSIINKAIKEDKYNPKRHPFLGFEFMKIVTSPKCLEPQQFKLMKGLIMDGASRYDKVNNKKTQYSPTIKKIGLKFLFQYYAYGMRVSDLLLLRWSNIYESGKRLKYTMYKTKQKMDIVLNNELLDILFEFMDYETRVSIINGSKEVGSKYKFKINDVVIAVNKKVEWYDLIRQKLYILSSHSEYKHNRIFSKIPVELKLDGNVKEVLSKISTYTAVYNKELKDLSKELEIDSPATPFNLSSHMARHTFAYLALLSGQSIYYISQALNHKSIKTTEIYLRGFDNRNLDGKFYKVDLSPSDKAAIDDKLSELIKNADYEKKKKIVDLFSL
jgi:integrase/recombinase XerD